MKYWQATSKPSSSASSSNGQKLEFEMSPDGQQLNKLHSQVSDLETITLNKTAKGAIPFAA